jgi:parvulin-like peptidyl-prolyl isomerase
MKLAHDIDDRARNGEDFGKLAVTYSQSETALDGGALGWRKGTELPTFLADAIARMKSGDVSDVMQTPSGFHIVKLNDSRSTGGPQIIQQLHLRHILLKPTEIEDDATVQQRLARWREQIVSGKEDFAVFAKTYSQDPGSAINGGDLGWEEPATFVPEFAKVAQEPEGGRGQHAISEPSLAGTSCKCWDDAILTTPMRPHVKRPTRRCVTAGSKRPPSCGSADSRRIIRRAAALTPSA